MFEFSLHKSLKQARTVLLLGAHSDDIEIGCGGTVLKLVDTYPGLHFYWVVLGSTGIRTDEAVKSANLFLNGVEHKKIVIKNFKDGFFPYAGAELKLFFEQLKKDVNPDLIFTHYRQDLHQDHRQTCELTWNTFRNHLILEYEIPKYDGDLGSPNLFVPLDETFFHRKINFLLDSFFSQTDKHWFTADTFQALMRIRGIESGSGAKWAEAYYGRKILWPL